MGVLGFSPLVYFVSNLINTHCNKPTLKGGTRHLFKFFRVSFTTITDNIQYRY